VRLIAADFQRVLELVDAAERKLIDAASRGEPANYATGDREADDPAKQGAEWGPGRAIRAEVIYALATGSRALGSALAVHAKGLQVQGAKIIGQLDFGGAEIRCRLALIRCHVDMPIILADATARSIALTGSHIGGIQAERLTVRGAMFLDAVTATAEVKFIGVAISGQLKCRGAHFSDLEGPTLNADGATIGGGVFLDQGFTAKGEVRFVRAQIAGELNCRGSRFDGRGAPALTADGVSASGGLFLDREFDEKGVPVGDPFTARGEVRLLHAEISGQLSCSGGTFENPNGYALSADGAIISGEFFLNRGFTANGKVRLPGAKIEGQLNCSGGKFEDADGQALNADGMIVGNLFLNAGFTALGEVRLLGAKVEGGFTCDGGKFENAGGVALFADNMTVGISVLLSQSFDGKANPVGEPFTATGEVRLAGAKIEGEFNCTGGKFAKPGGRALNATSVAVGGNISLNGGFTSEGEVRLDGAKIERLLNCGGGKFLNASGRALFADHMIVGGSVFLNRGFVAKGEVRMVGAEIGGQLNCRGGRFEKTDRSASPDAPLAALAIFGVTVGGALLLDKLAAKPIGRIDLGHAKARLLADDITSWPEAENDLNLNGLILDGFQYGAIDVDSPTDARRRIEWVGLQPTDSFSFQPYEQLAQVLRRMGDEAGAREVMIAKQGKLREIERLKTGLSNWRFRSANWVFKWIVGYGYRPWLALLWAAAIVVIGWPVFSLAHGSGVLVNSNPVAAAVDLPAPAYQAVALPITHSHPIANAVVAKIPPAPTSAKEFFHPLLFSLDVFLPAPDLGLKKVWVLKASREWDWAFYGYEAWYLAEGILGWALTILFTGALSGLIRKE
jgi:hypothetical protein